MKDCHVLCAYCESKQAVLEGKFCSSRCKYNHEQELSIWVPTEREIEQQMATIRDSWSPIVERQRRLSLPYLGHHCVQEVDDDMTVPMFTQHHDGTFTSTG